MNLLDYPHSSSFTSLFKTEYDVLAIKILSFIYSFPAPIFLYISPLSQLPHSWGPHVILTPTYPPPSHFAPFVCFSPAPSSPVPLPLSSLLHSSTPSAPCSCARQAALPPCSHYQSSRARSRGSPAAAPSFLSRHAPSSTSSTLDLGRRTTWHNDGPRYGVEDGRELATSPAPAKISLVLLSPELQRGLGGSGGGPGARGSQRRSSRAPLTPQIIVVQFVVVRSSSWRARSRRAWRWLGPRVRENGSVVRRRPATLAQVAVVASPATPMLLRRASSRPRVTKGFTFLPPSVMVRWRCSSSVATARPFLLSPLPTEKAYFTPNLLGLEYITPTYENGFVTP
jgi:hypothetical protein